MTANTISVVIPAYNMQDYIGECLNSIINQNQKVDEIIIINDGSKDRTAEVAQKYVDQYNFIRLFNYENGGLCAARNRGLRQATSDYVMFLDSDDKMPQGAIKKCKQIIEEHAPDVIVGRIEFFTSRKKWTGKSYDQVCCKDYLTTFQETPGLINCMNVGPKCFNRQFLIDHGSHFYEGVMMTEDHWFSMAVMSKAEKVFITKSILFNYRRDREESSTVTPKLSYFSDIFQVQKALTTISFPHKEAYFKRLITFDLIKYGTEYLKGLPDLDSKLEAARFLQQTLHAIPEECRVYFSQDQNEIFDSPDKFIEKFFQSKISVVIPAFNVEEYISECLDSVLNQSIPADEIIVVNDGSTDNTGFIARMYARKHPNIQVKEYENSGLCSARNKGLLGCHNEYVIFLDSDDIMGVDCIKKCKAIIYEHHPDVIVGRLQFISRKKKWGSKAYDSVCSFDHRTTFEKSPELVNCMNVGPKCFKTEFLKSNAIQFLEGIMMTEDHWFSLQAFAASKTIYVTNQILFNYRKDREDSATTKTNLSHFKDMLEVQKRIHDLSIPNKEEYYKRFIKSDLRIYGTERVLQLPSKDDQAVAVNLLKAIIDILPQESYRYLNVDQRLILKNPEGFLGKKRRKENVNKLLGCLVKPIIPLAKRAYESLNKRYIKNRKDRRKWLKLMYRILSILPTEKNSVLFCIRPSSKMNNMQIIYDRLVDQGGFKLRKLQAKEVSLMDDFRCMYRIAKAENILIDGDYYFLFDLNVRKTTQVIQLWHAGGAFKKFGCDIYNKDSKEWKQQSEHHISYSYVITSSDFCKQFYSSAFNISQDKIISLGVPRTDNLYKVNVALARAKLYKKFGIPEGKKLILYAPTFREPNGAFNKLDVFQNHIDVGEFNRRFGSEYILALRIHPNYKDASNFPEGTINVSTYPQDELLAAADILITDYSSILFDFAYFKRPIISYAYDITSYVKERSFYMNYDHIVPGAIATDNEELFEAIAQCEEQSSQEVAAFWTKFMGACDGQSTDRIIKLICKGKTKK